ncbi:hypothetical protein V8C43DRAFT_31572 [Trichoderma afarasin]
MESLTNCFFGCECIEPFRKRWCSFASYRLIHPIQAFSTKLFMDGRRRKVRECRARTNHGIPIAFFLFVSPKCVHACTYRQTVISWCVRDCVCENGHGGLCQLLGWLVRAQLLYEYMHASDVDESAYEYRAAVNQDLVSLSLSICSVSLSLSYISQSLSLLSPVLSQRWLAPNPRHSQFVGDVRS